MTPTTPSPEIAVLLPLAVSLATTLTTIVVHAIALMAIVQLVRREHQLGHAGVGFWRDVAIVTGAILVALIAHLVEMMIWAAVFVLCGEFTDFSTAFYHSTMNYTSLGYGDIVMSASWKLLGPLEAANGLLLFGVTTAMIFAVIQRLFQTRHKYRQSPSP